MLHRGAVVTTEGDFLFSVIEKSKKTIKDIIVYVREIHEFPLLKQKISILMQILQKSHKASINNHLRTK